jgi:hypothetical protein
MKSSSRGPLAGRAGAPTADCIAKKGERHSAPRFD